MKTMINKVHLEGKLYQHNLTLKKTGANSKNPGTEFISGTIDIATNDALTNIVSVHYTYVVATYPAKNGKPERPNPNFDILADIIAGKYTTVMGSGADSATKISVDSNIGVNDFYTDRQLDEKGEPTLVTAKRNEGGFIHIINALRTDENRRNTFETDILITGFSIKEADEENGYPEKGIIKGAVFDFRNSLLPVELSVLNPKAIAYFEGLEPSAENPVFTRVSGNEVSEVVKKTITTEGAFGDEVREVESNRKDFLVNWAQPEVYDFGDESVLTKDEVKKMVTDRQEYLAEVKGRYVEYKNSKSSAPAAASTSSDGAFNF